jgi:hypothetical protein
MTAKEKLEAFKQKHHKQIEKQIRSTNLIKPSELAEQEES